MDFESLYTTALSEWPPELRFPVWEADTGLHVEGLAELERGISSRWRGHPHAVLMDTLHWNILRAVHLAFATRDSVDMTELPDVRGRFEEDLKLLSTSRHVRDADRVTVRTYLAAAAPAIREKEPS